MYKSVLFRHSHLTQGYRVHTATGHQKECGQPGLSGCGSVEFQKVRQRGGKSGAAGGNMHSLCSQRPAQPRQVRVCLGVVNLNPRANRRRIPAQPVDDRRFFRLTSQDVRQK